MRTALADVVAGALLLALTAYSTAGGVDFGAGIWDLLAGRGERGKAARDLIDHAMAPVWEVNNVWLVLGIVLTWTGFPMFFQAVFLQLYPLFTLALVGLVLRGAFFAFRHVAEEPGQRRLADLVFGVSSVLTPFFFAASLGAIASGAILWGPLQFIVYHAPPPAWQVSFTPMAFAFGAVSVAATAFSGAVFLVGDARRHSPDLVDYFRARALAAAAALVVVGTLALGVIGVQRPQLITAMLTGPGAPFTYATMVLTPVVAGLLWRRIYRGYRVLTVAAVGSLVLAWGVAQSPYLLPGWMTIEQAAAPAGTLWLLVVVGAGIALVIGPGIALLIYLDQKNLLESTH